MSELGRGLAQQNENPLSPGIDRLWPSHLHQSLVSILLLYLGFDLPCSFISPLLLLPVFPPSLLSLHFQSLQHLSSFLSFARFLGVARHDLDFISVDKLSILQLESNVFDKEGPDFVTESICVEMSLLRRGEKVAFSLRSLSYIQRQLEKTK